MRTTSTNQSFNELHSIILKTIDRYAPEKTVLAKQKQHQEPWVMPRINKKSEKTKIIIRRIS